MGNHSDPQSLAGSIKYIEQATSSARAKGGHPIDIYLSTYEQPYEDFGAKAQHYALSRSPTFHGQQGLKILLPMLLKDGESLDQLAPEELKERLSHITLVGHSFGSIAIQDTVNALVSKLQQMHWKDAEIDDTVKELVTISVASIARTDFKPPNATQFFFTSLNDMTAVDVIRRATPDPQTHIPLLRKCGYRRLADILDMHERSNPGAIIPRPQILAELKEAVMKTRHPGQIPKPLIEADAGHNQYVVKAMLPDDEIRWIEKRADGTELVRTIDKQESERTQTSVVHDFRTYLYGEHRLGEVLINVMNNAVERGVDIGDGHSLMASNPHTREQHALRLRGHHAAHAQNGPSTSAETRSR